MNVKLAEQVLGDAKAAVEDATQLSQDVKTGAQLRWRLLIAEFTLFKLGCGRLLILVPVLILFVLIAAISLSSLIGYSVFALSGSPLLAILVVLALQLTVLVLAGMRALTTLNAMNFARSRAHLLKLSRHVLG